MKRICIRCKQNKELIEFHKDSSRNDGVQRTCKSCQRNQNRAWQQNHREHRRKYDKEYYTKNREKIKITKRAQHHHISIEELKEILSKGCAICGSFFQLQIDHNHKTRKIRKALCRRCNLVLGHVENNVEIIFRLIQYLKENN